MSVARGGWVMEGVSRAGERSRALSLGEHTNLIKQVIIQQVVWWKLSSSHDMLCCRST